MPFSVRPHRRFPVQRFVTMPYGGIRMTRLLLIALLLLSTGCGGTHYVFSGPTNWGASRWAKDDFECRQASRSYSQFAMGGMLVGGTDEDPNIRMRCLVARGYTAKLVDD
jgi:hypothetical protein